MNTHETHENQDPQSLIGGSVYPSEISHLDYLSFTLPYIERHADAIPYVRDFAEATIWCAPRKGYTHAQQFENGARMDWHPGNPAQGVGFVYGGESLERLRRAGVSDQRLLKDISSVGAKFTRVDIAINTAIPDASAAQLKDAFERGAAVTRAKGFTMIEGGGSKQGQTFYLGSRTSEQMLRFYDKAAQKGHHGMTWWRAELELKGRHAQHFVEEAAYHALPALIQRTIKGFCDFPDLPFWGEMMGDAEAGKQLRLPRTETNTEKWLKTQVLPALQKLSITDVQTLLRFFRAAAHERGLLMYMEVALLEELAFKEWERSQGREGRSGALPWVSEADPS